MPLNRSEKDMFGRPAEPERAPGTRQSKTLRQRSIPPGLVPFVPVILLAVLLIAFAINVYFGIAMAVLFVATILVLRYRAVKDIDYGTLRQSDPWAGFWSRFRRWNG